MKKKPEKRAPTDDLRADYDFSALKSGVRGKYLRRYRKTANLVKRHTSK